MKERPILFSGGMVKAILDGRKTQTRRTVKPMAGEQSEWLTPELIAQVPHGEIIKGGWQMHHPKAGTRHTAVGITVDEPYDSPLGRVRCPYGVPGDRLWVRETFLGWYGKNGFSHVAEFAADGYELEPGEKWRPSIFMPRAASRLTLEITNVRVERLQDISGADVLAEGIDLDPDNVPDDIVPFFHAEAHGEYQTQAGLNEAWDAYARAGYAKLWDKINGKKHPWESNPWVWVIEFQKI